jgi:hypothetical protein
MMHNEDNTYENYGIFIPITIFSSISGKLDRTGAGEERKHIGEKDRKRNSRDGREEKFESRKGRGNREKEGNRDWREGREAVGKRIEGKVSRDKRIGKEKTRKGKGIAENRDKKSWG